MTDVSQYRERESSVTLGDFPKTTTDGGHVLFVVPDFGLLNPHYLQAPYQLPTSFLGRDRWLRYSPNLEVMWGNAVGIALTKMASVEWVVESTTALRARRARELLLHAGGDGWVRFISKIVKDFLTTSNGAFIEVERQGPGMGSRIVALHHLDSLRCRRTGNIEEPVVYTDNAGDEHALKYWQVIAFSDMPSTSATAFDSGMCAAERAWKRIVSLHQMERYVWESVSGHSPTEIHFVGNVNLKDVAEATTVADAKRRTMGHVSHMGAVVVGSLAKDSPVSVVSVPLKRMPEHFDPELERKTAYLQYAAAIGLDPQDLQPITNQALGAGAQSQILADKAKGQGLAALRLDLVHQINEMILDETTTFSFSELDWGDEEKKTIVKKVRAETRAVQVKSGEISREEARQIAAEEGDIPEEFVQQDLIDYTVIEDTEKDPPIEESPEAVSDTLPVQQKERDELEEQLEEVTREYLMSQFRKAAEAIRGGS